MNVPHKILSLHSFRTSLREDDVTLADDFTSTMQTFAMAEQTDGLGKLCECISRLEW